MSSLAARTHAALSSQKPKSKGVAQKVFRSLDKVSLKVQKTPFQDITNKADATVEVTEPVKTTKKAEPKVVAAPVAVEPVKPSSAEEQTGA